MPRSTISCRCRRISSARPLPIRRNIGCAPRYNTEPTNPGLYNGPYRANRDGRRRARPARTQPPLGRARPAIPPDHRARDPREIATHLLDLAGRTRSRGPLLGAHLALGLTATYEGELSAAEEHLARVVAMLAAGGRREFRSLFDRVGLVEPQVACAAYRELISCARGLLDRGRDTIEDGRRIARATGNAYALVTAEGFAAMVHQSRAGAGDGGGTGDDTIALAQEHGFPAVGGAGRGPARLGPGGAGRGSGGHRGDPRRSRDLAEHRGRGRPSDPPGPARRRVRTRGSSARRAGRARGRPRRGGTIRGALHRGRAASAAGRAARAVTGR